VVPVPRRADGDDPYLVVAADKGTATMSDRANRISTSRGFWLGDAFASGGSSGYDHKRLGITARGAWVAVTHHFAGLDVDLGTESVTVVGIGDMSGDVFGNAMLRSDRIRLVAAFDHRDIFVDPDPDPLASYQERARLHALPGSSWQDYDRSRLSPGGGVWSRLEKRIRLSDQVRAALRVDADEVTSPELVRAILQAPVDLLFAGGIGTFVRAATEPDHELDDRTNSEIRVEAGSIRCRVVGEGANLAFTQRARVEYARRGGRINTDAIDNSAGVDISDHEVNLKILLGLAHDAGELGSEERDQLLVEVCDDVVERVLSHTARQSALLTRAQASSPGRMEALESLLAELEADEVVDRHVEALPTGEEMRARANAGAGLTRPELAVLAAGAKRGVTAGLLASSLPDQPALRGALASYFPDRLAERFDHLLDRHRLRRELVASVVANDVVDRMGPTFVARIVREIGTRADAVVAAYSVARGVAGAPAWWTAVDSGSGAGGTEALVAAADAVSALLETLTRDYLRREETDDIAAVVARDRPAFAELERAMGDIGPPHRRRLRAHRAEALVASGVQPDLAGRLACLRDLEIGPPVAELARRAGRPATGVARAMLQLGESLGIDRLVDHLGRTTIEDRWSRAAWRGLHDDLLDLRRLTTRQALEEHPGEDEVDAVVRFLDRRTDQVAEISVILRDVDGDAPASLDAVMVAYRAVRGVVG
jgi:glutamate dehydrogenase